MRVRVGMLDSGRGRPPTCSILKCERGALLLVGSGVDRGRDSLQPTSLPLCPRSPSLLPLFSRGGCANNHYQCTTNADHRPHPPTIDSAFTFSRELLTTCFSLGPSLGGGPSHIPRAGGGGRGSQGEFA